MQTTFTDRRLDQEEVIGLHLQAWGLLSVIDMADATIGHEKLDEAFDHWGVDVRNLIQSRAWMTFSFAERVMAKVAELCGSEVITQAGWRSMSPQYLGPIYPLVRATGNTASTLERIVKSAPRYNKARDLSLIWSGPQHATLRLAAVKGVPPPRTRMFCQFVRAQVESVPMLFGLKPARVVSEKCICDGDEACEIEFVWQRAPRKIPVFPAGVVAGVAAGLGAGALVSTPAGVTVGAVSGLAVVAAGIAFRRGREIAQQLAQINEHREALLKSVHDNEVRFAEVVEAKTRVEQRVQERTKQLETALEELRALDEAKTEFFANVSHELRTPLTLILSPIDSLKSTSNSAVLETMEQNARRLLRMINQLLDLAKVDAKKVSLSPAPTSPKMLLERVISPYRQAASDRSIHLEIGSAADGTVELDPAWMESALTNLLANALRYARTSIVASATDDGAEIVFTVRDDGPGIDEETRDTIFQRFAQARGTEGGTGIGLAIVQETARLHGGRATVDVTDEGTSFAIRIPRVVARGSADTLPPSTPAIVDPVDAGVIEEPGPFPGAPRLLVAEDHPELRRFIVDVLAPRFAVTGVPNGSAALQHAVEHRPDAIVSDVMMPKMGGHELTRELRAHPATKDVPILLVTARGEPQDVIEGFDAGADDYIVKPFHGRELLARIDAQLRLRTMLHRLAHQERLASLGVLAASVAHQVRNPLTALVSGLPAVRSKIAPKVDERTQEMLGIFVDCSKRIERITLDLLDLSRVDREEDGKLRPGQGLMSAVRLTCAQLPADVDVHTEVDQETEISGRAGDLNHVFLNLLDNASKAIDRKGTIRISGTADNGLYRVRIEDSGPGIPPDVADRIFEPFVTKRDNGEGTGLGLAIVSDVVKAHGGTIRCGRSEQLGGAEFVVELPT